MKKFVLFTVLGLSLFALSGCQSTIDESLKTVECIARPQTC